MTIGNKYIGGLTVTVSRFSLTSTLNRVLTMIIKYRRVLRRWYTIILNEGTPTKDFRIDGNGYYIFID